MHMVNSLVSPDEVVASGRKAFRSVLFFVLAYGIGLTNVRSGSPVFEGPEIFPLGPRIDHLVAADLDGNTLSDLVVINHRKSRLELLYNRSDQMGADEPAPATAVPTARRDLSLLPPDARFRTESISCEERITSLVVVDFVGDGLPDILYGGNLDEVILLENRGPDGWREAEKWAVPDIVSHRDAVQVGDFDGDGRIEVVVLAESFFYFIQSPKGEGKKQPNGPSSRPLKQRHSGDVGGFLVMDINHDGADDLICQSSGSSGYDSLRLGGTGGISTSDMMVEMGLNRFVGPLNEKAGELVAIAQRSGRARIGQFRLESNSVDDERVTDGQLVRLALPTSSQVDQGVLWLDLNRDGRMDLTTVDPDGGKLLVQLQNSELRFDAIREYGSLVGVTQLAGADWDGDGRPEIFLMSDTEKQVGMTEWRTTGGVSFPETFDLRGTPVAMSVGTLRSGAPASLVVLVRSESGHRLFVRHAESEPQRFDITLPVEVRRAKMVMHDVDQDGWQDLVVLAPYEDLLVLRQREGGKGFEGIQLKGSLRDLERPWVGRLDTDGDGRSELVLPQKNAVRGVVMVPRGERDEWQLRVKVQINGVENQSVIGGIVALKTTDGRAAEVCLLDVGTSQLSCLRQASDGQWQLVESFVLPRGDYTSVERDIGNVGGEPALFLSGTGAAFVKMLGGGSWRFSSDHSYETGESDGVLGLGIGADFDADGLRELVFLETAEHHVELVSGGITTSTDLLYRWPVFESRTFRTRRSELPEPREALVKDVSGDGRPDLLLLVHDRILLYPQK